LRFPGLVVEPTRNGVGLIATRGFRQGAKVARISGRIYHWRVLWRRGGAFLDNCFRSGENTYLDPGSGPGRYLNHSCEPNAGIRRVGRRLELFAARRIEPGDEVVIDYSTTIGDDDIWRMRCHCGSGRCRKWVGRFGLLPEKLRREYLRRGLVPSSIIASLD